MGFSCKIQELKLRKLAKAKNLSTLYSERRNILIRTKNGYLQLPPNLVNIGVLMDRAKEVVYQRWVIIISLFVHFIIRRYFLYFYK